MRYDEFLDRVRERGEYAGQDEAATVTEAVLGVLAQRITAGEVDDLASQLPGPLGKTLADAKQPQAAGPAPSASSGTPTGRASWVRP